MIDFRALLFPPRGGPLESDGCPGELELRAGVVFSLDKRGFVVVVWNRDGEFISKYNPLEMGTSRT